jgi:hypothetical protein
MNWKLSFQLSMFGLIMAFGTISLIPFKIEPVFWLVIFVACAYVIAKVCTQKYFLQGLWVGLFNCVWIIAAHFIFFTSYAAHHANMLIYPHPRIMAAVTGPVAGIVSGCIIGLFAFIASKLVKTKAAQQ